MDDLLMDVIDIPDRRQIAYCIEAEASKAPTTPFILEFASNPDSDLEDDSEEIPSVAKSRTVPFHRESLFVDDDSDDEEDEGSANPDARPSTNSWNWKRGCIKPRSIPFTGKQGLRVEMDQDAATPMDYLKLLVTDRMMDSIVNETNRYAEETLKDMELSPASRFRTWTPVIRNEMWAFFGLVTQMGIIILEDIDDYWNADALFCLPFFRAVMTRDRFRHILSFLHVCDNNLALEETHPDHNPLFKIFNFVSELNLNFQLAYMPGKHITIDEAMVAWGGPLSFKVTRDNKLARNGIKIFELCDSETGYCCDLDVYSSKKRCSSHGAAFDIVDHLSSPYQGCGRILYVDSNYTSPELFKHLYHNKTMACGTVRLNGNVKNGPPKAMVPTLTKENASSIYTMTNGTMNLIYFYDQRAASILTTAHDNSEMTVKENVVKLDAVNEFNKFMGAVDRSDKMVSNNAFRRRKLKLWKKAFFHMFALGILNSYILHKGNASKKLTHTLFRRVLVKQLVQYTPMLVTPYVRDCNVGSSSIFRLIARHFITPIQPKPGNKTKTPQRVCVVCCEPNKKSRYECPTCDVGLHIYPCFEIYHTQENYKQGVKRKFEED